MGHLWYDKKKKKKDAPWYNSKLEQIRVRDYYISAKSQLNGVTQAVSKTSTNNESLLSLRAD